MSQSPANPPSFTAPPTIGGFIPAGRPKTSVMAMLSLIMGVLGPCTGITAIFGVVFGVIALKQINRSQDRLGGRGVAIAGTCVSSIALVFACIGVGIILPAIGRARYEVQKAQQELTLKQLGIFCNDYMDGNNDRFPPVDHWEEVFAQKHGDISGFIATPFDPGVRRAVAMNAKLRGKSRADVARPADTVLMFEVHAGSPQAGSEDLLPAQPRTSIGYAILFVDGHVAYVKPEQMRSVVWEP